MVSMVLTCFERMKERLHTGRRDSSSDENHLVLEQVIKAKAVCCSNCQSIITMLIAHLSIEANNDFKVQNEF